jgi:alanyl-tRNA synthetase
VLAAGKAQAGAFRDKAVSACTAAAAGKRVATLRCDVDTDADALRAGALAAAQQHGCAVAIVSADADKDKLMVYISVPPEVEALGLDCKAWLAAALAPVGGKGGGGKGGLAQGQAQGAAKAGEALAAAQQFADAALKGKL